MEGIHLLGEWYGCPADEPLLTQADALRDLCRRAIDDSGLTIVGDRFFQFEPQGVTMGYSGQSFQERAASGQAGLVFALGLVIVFLVLAAQYESWSSPFAVLFGVPFGA